MGVQAFNENVPVNIANYIQIGAGTTPLDLGGFAPTNIRIDQIWLSNDDAIDHIVILTFFSGGAHIPLGSHNIPAGTGHAGTPAIELLSALSPLLGPGIALGPNDNLGVGVAVAMVGASHLDIVAFGGTL